MRYFPRFSKHTHASLKMRMKILQSVQEVLQTLRHLQGFGHTILKIFILYSLQAGIGCVCVGHGRALGIKRLYAGKAYDGPHIEGPLCVGIVWIT